MTEPITLAGNETITALPATKGLARARELLDAGHDFILLTAARSSDGHELFVVRVIQQRTSHLVLLDGLVETAARLSNEELPSLLRMAAFFDRIGETASIDADDAAEAATPTAEPPIGDAS